MQGLVDADDREPLAGELRAHGVGAGPPVPPGPVGVEHDRPARWGHGVSGRDEHAGADELLLLDDGLPLGVQAEVAARGGVGLVASLEVGREVVPLELVVVGGLPLVAHVGPRGDRLGLQERTNAPKIPRGPSGRETRGDSDVHRLERARRQPGAERLERGLSSGGEGVRERLRLPQDAPVGTAHGARDEGAERLPLGEGEPEHGPHGQGVGTVVGVRSLPIKVELHRPPLPVAGALGRHVHKLGHGQRVALAQGSVGEGREVYRPVELYVDRAVEPEAVQHLLAVGEVGVQQVHARVGEGAEVHVAVGRAESIGRPRRGRPALPAGLVARGHPGRLRRPVDPQPAHGGGVRSQLARRPVPCGVGAPRRVAVRAVRLPAVEPRGHVQPTARRRATSGVTARGASEQGEPRDDHPPRRERAATGAGLARVTGGPRRSWRTQHRSGRWHGRSLKDEDVTRT